MNRTQLVDKVSEDTGLSRRESERAVAALIYEITVGVRSGEPVRVTGFGTFKRRDRRARAGRNPQTGDAVKVKASFGIGFTPGVQLKADLNTKAKVAVPPSLAKTQKAPLARTRKPPLSPRTRA